MHNLSSKKQSYFNAVEKIPEVITINNLSAIYMGTDDIVVDLDIKLKKDLTTREIEHILDTIKEEIIHDIPQAKHINIDLNSLHLREEITIEKK